LFGVQIRNSAYRSPGRRRRARVEPNLRGLTIVAMRDPNGHIIGLVTETATAASKRMCWSSAQPTSVARRSQTKRHYLNRPDAESCIRRHRHAHGRKFEKTLYPDGVRLGEIVARVEVGLWRRTKNFGRMCTDWYTTTRSGTRRSC